MKVGSEAYFSLKPKERFNVAVDAFTDYTARTDYKWHIAQQLEEEIYALRVMCSMGREGHPEEADPVWDILHNSFIRSYGLGGGITLFGNTISPAQTDDLLAVFEADRVAGIPGRYWLAKTRRVGGSLTIGQWIRTRTSRQPGQRALIVAHEKDAAEEIFEEIYKTPWENDPLKPPAKHASKRELSFHEMGSKLRVGLSKSEGGGAGTGFHRIHWSEILRYEEDGVDVEDLVTNHLQTMPQTVETFAIGESSGRGDGGVAYEWFQDAYKDPTAKTPGVAPKRGWRALFLASYQRWDAQKPIESEAEREDLRESMDEVERHIVDKLNVPLEHIKWRRWYETTQIKAKSPKRKKQLMAQECPLTWSDCFQAKGTREFDGNRIRELLFSDMQLEPKWVGELWHPDALYDSKKFAYDPKTPMPKWRETDEGEILVWEKPIGEKERLQTGALPHRYCMGVDIAEGNEDGNWSVVHLIDRDTKNLVAAYRGHAKHDELLKIVRFMSRWYNDALIANEVNRFKKWTEDLAATDRANYMYIRREGRDSIDRDTQGAFGWLTTPASKDTLVDALHQVLEYVPQFLRWKLLLEEMKTFRREAKNQRRGKGAKADDDTVMAAAICYYCDRDMPKHGKDPLKYEAQADEGKTALDLQFEEWRKQQKQARRRAPGGRDMTKLAKRQFP